MFFTVAQAGSVNKAAVLLGTSQPTLSRRLAELERHVGAPLFFRTPSGVRLTDEGEELFRSAQAVQATFSSFQREYRERLGARSSLIKVSATEGFTRHWLVPRIAALRRQFPNLAVSVDANIRQQSLSESDLDFVIRLGDPGESDLIGRRVAELEFGYFASEPYLREHGVPSTMADLADHDLIAGAQDAVFKSLRPDDMVVQRRMQAAMAEASVRLHPFAAVHDGVTEGLGIAMLAVPFARADGLVRVLPLEGFWVDIWLLRRRESDRRPLTREVGRFLERELTTSHAWLAGRASPADLSLAAAAGEA